METVVRAYAKLNLTLDVTARRGDGYHELKSIMQSVTLHDRIRITTGCGGEARASTNFDFLPGDDKNIAVLAAKRFFERTGIEHGGVMLDIDKHIPVCAGLGGGSSDAAAVLRGLNGMYGSPLEDGAMYGLALELGSDVPYCLHGGTMLAEGRGEVLRELPALPDCYAVIVKPRFSISTRKLFSQLDVHSIAERPDTPGAIEALNAGDLTGIARRMFNVLESALGPRQRAIPEISQRLLDLGALGSSMTGSGSAVFGLFDRREAARKAMYSLRSRCPDTFLTTTIPAY